nr:RDD family protein [Bacteroidota bacterium]
TLNDTILNRVASTYVIVYPEVSRLTDSDIAIIKEVMQMSIRTGNFQAIEKLAVKTKAAMGITVSLPHAQFLSTVVQDYSQYNFER